MEIQPLYDKIVVKRAEARTQTDSGLYLPGKEDAPQEGEVLAIGGGLPLEGNVELRPLVAKKGDRVLFGKYSGTEIVLEGEELLILREDDVLAIIVPNSEDVAS